MKSKYIGTVINGFRIINSFSIKNANGKYNSVFDTECMKCGKRETRYRNNVISGQSVCQCSYVKIRHNSSGLTKTRLHHIYRSMIDRCFNEKSKAYKWYGARGIIVCSDWYHDFMKFKEWSERNGYRDGLSIDRIDSNSNYCPENCEWVTVSENVKRRNLYVAKLH